MELLDIIVKTNEVLEQSVLFQAFKFILATYLWLMALVIVLLLYILLIRKKYWYDFSFGRSVPKMRGVMDKEWAEVAEVIRNNDVNHYKFAVVEAGKILFKTLERLGYPGKDLTEQLNQMVGYQITNLEDVKWADNIRRAILEDVNYELSSEDAKKAVRAFGEAIWEMEAITDINL